MRKFIIAICFALMGCDACGHESVNNELIGQVKKVANQTPLICSDRIDADISLGVMRNGVGSVSTQDIWFTVPNQKDADLLKKAAGDGSVVKVTYQVERFVWCWNAHVVTGVEVVP